MKRAIYSFLTVSLIALVIFSCEKNNDNDMKQIVTGQLVGNSTCKKFLKSSAQIVVTPDTLSCVVYSFDKEKNKLTLKHINAGFNCCPDSLYCKIELKGDTILIQEFEKTAQCDCNCLYDLDIDINGVDLKKYQVKFVEPYAIGQNIIEFEIDLLKVTNGTYCVFRKLYPWGIHSLNE